MNTIKTMFSSFFNMPEDEREQERERENESELKIPGELTATNYIKSIIEAWGSLRMLTDVLKVAFPETRFIIEKSADSALNVYSSTYKPLGSIILYDTSTIFSRISITNDYNWIKIYDVSCDSIFLKQKTIYTSLGKTLSFVYRDNSNYLEKVLISKRNFELSFKFLSLFTCEINQNLKETMLELIIEEIIPKEAFNVSQKFFQAKNIEICLTEKGHKKWAITKKNDKLIGFEVHTHAATVKIFNENFEFQNSKIYIKKNNNTYTIKYNSNINESFEEINNAIKKIEEIKKFMQKNIS